MVKCNIQMADTKQTVVHTGVDPSLLSTPAPSPSAALTPASSPSCAAATSCPYHGTPTSGSRKEAHPHNNQPPSTTHLPAQLARHCFARATVIFQSITITTSIKTQASSRGTRSPPPRVQALVVPCLGDAANSPKAAGTRLRLVVATCVVPNLTRPRCVSTFV